MTEHSNLLPKLIFHHYWDQKADFLLGVDTYAHWSMIAVEDGCFKYDFASSSGTASNGEIVICPPNTSFRRKTVTPLSFHFIIFTWESEQSDSQILEGSLMGKIRLHDTKRLYSNYHYLRSKAEHYAPADELLKSHMLKDIWLLHCEEMNRTISISEHVSDDLLMNKVAEYFKQNLEKPQKVKAIADSLGLSPVQLTRQFFRAYGITPIDFLTSIRLQRAKNLLMETDLSLHQIALSCGYENGFYFSRIFTKKMKVSPSVYRESYRV